MRASGRDAMVGVPRAKKGGGVHPPPPRTMPPGARTLTEPPERPSSHAAGSEANARPRGAQEPQNADPARLEPNETLGTVACPGTVAVPTARGDAERTRAAETSRASDAVCPMQRRRVLPCSEARRPSSGAPLGFCRHCGRRMVTVLEGESLVVVEPGPARLVIGRAFVGDVPIDPGWDRDARPVVTETTADGRVLPLNAGWFGPRVRREEDPAAALARELRARVLANHRRRRR
jgi:hypothetical protein